MEIAKSLRKISAESGPSGGRVHACKPNYLETNTLSLLEAAAGGLFLGRIFATSDPRNAPANPATCEATGFKATLSAANDTAQKPSRLAPATLVILETFIL
jgi:hypothetical protein